MEGRTMKRSHLGALVAATLLLAVILPPAGWSEDRQEPPAAPKVVTRSAPAKACDGEALAYRVYPLGALSAAPELGRWVTETLPQMVRPESWVPRGGPGTLSYYPPARVLAVYQTAAVHAQVEAFLGDLRRATTAKAAGDGGVIQAKGAAPAPLPITEPAEKMTYPVPAAAKAPKHLFHFIIRYEGEGLLDSNVVEYLKLQGDASRWGAVTPAVNGSTPPMVQPAPQYGTPPMAQPRPPAGPAAPATGNPPPPPLDAQPVAPAAPSNVSPTTLSQR
jgi:hypothetical protein